MSKFAPAPDRRSEILAAALACFLEKGYAATSIADIRSRSGASTGSIYHFFAGKPALALALVDRAVAGWSAASAAAFAPGASAEQSIRASVAGLVTWGLANPAECRFLDEIRTIADADRGFAAVRDRFASGRNSGEALYAGYVERGEVRALPWPLAHALMLGAAYDFLRLASGSDGAVPPTLGNAPALLAEAAWQAVRRA